MALKEERNVFERIGDMVKGFCFCLAVFFAGDLLGPTINPMIFNMFTGSAPTQEPVKQEEIQKIEETKKNNLFYCICLWEGRGQIRPNAIGDTDTPYPAYGPAQIRLPYLSDANRQLYKEGHETYCLKDMLDYNKAEIVFEAYMRKYNILGDEKRSRCHNGGPNGYKRSSTLKYWEGVKSYLYSGKEC